MKKRVLIMLMAGILVFSVCGCQSKQADDVTQNKEQQNVAEDTGMEKEDIQDESIEIEEVENEDIENDTDAEEHDENYIGDMHDPWASEYVDDVELEFADESDGVISNQLFTAEEYGYFETKDHQFINEYDDVVYSYEIECLYFYKESVPDPVIAFMDKYYAEKEAEYQDRGDEELDADWRYRLAVQNGEIEPEVSEEDMESEVFEGESENYDKLIFQYISYIGEDYVSLVYYDATYMGGAHTYATLEGITIDCKTGEEVTAKEVLGIKNEAELRCEISDKMGTEELLTWDELDFYITDKAIVFFGKQYWMQGNYDDVVVLR